MPFDAARAASKTDAISLAFRSIGDVADAAVGTESPSLRWANEPKTRDAAKAAWEYHVASALLQLAAKRRDAAITAAVKAGVLFDHKKAPLPAGTQRVVYTDPFVEVAVKVEEGRAGVNHPGYVADLLLAKVDPKLLARLDRKHATTSASPHKFTSSLVTR